MPKLVMCIPCEKAIEGKDESISLISLMYGTTIRAGVVEGQKPPAEIGIPMRWCIFSLWHKEPGDDGVDFHFTAQLSAPSGHICFKQAVPFRMLKQYHRVIASVDGFPTGESGIYKLAIYFAAGDGNMNILQEYEFTVTHEPIGSIKETSKTGTQ